MVLIKLSARYKIAAIVTTALLASFTIVSLAFQTDDKQSELNENSVDITVTQSYVSESRDECIDTTNNIQEQSSCDSIDTEIIPETDSYEALYIQYYTEQDAIDIAKVLYRECRGVPSVTEQACVAWTILNRVDYGNDSIYRVVREPDQFAFSEGTLVDDELLLLANDVLDRWNREKNGETDVGRVLPKEYRYFEGHSGHNYFRNQYDGSYEIWNYSNPSPYGS